MKQAVKMEILYKMRNTHSSSGYLLLQRINDLADLTKYLVHRQLGVDLSEGKDTRGCEKKKQKKQNMFSIP